VFDPFSYDGDVNDEGQEYKTEANEADSVASGSTKETPEPVVGPAIDAVTRSFSEDESEARSLPVSAPPTPIPTTEDDDEVDIAVPEYEEEVAVPLRYLDVDLALNEDLTCEYKKSKLSSITVDGTVQVSVFRLSLFTQVTNLMFMCCIIPTGPNQEPRGTITRRRAAITHTILFSVSRSLSSYQVSTRKQKVRRARRCTKHCSRVHLLHHCSERE
jgi:hypothetical protein